jgi:hypothetical protein
MRAVIYTPTTNTVTGPIVQTLEGSRESLLATLAAMQPAGFVELDDTVDYETFNGISTTHQVVNGAVVAK